MNRKRTPRGQETGDWSSTVAEAVEWRLLALLLERPRAGWHAEVAALGREVPDLALAAAAQTAQEAGEGEYLRVLGPGGSVSPREVAYRSYADPGQLLAQLATVYQVWAFQPRVEEPIDHIAVEAGFVGYLLLKEAFAGARHDAQAAATVAAARRMFIDTHLAAIVHPFVQRLEAVGPAYLVQAVHGLVARVPPQPATAPRPPLPDACATCDPLAPV